MFRQLDIHTLEAQFAGMSVAPASGPDAVRYTVVLSPTGSGRVFSDTFATGNIGAEGIGQVSFGGEGDEDAPLPFGDYELVGHLT